ncbi:hypothetical protein HQQ80_12845 [Microbacteriaceae bacterium VKM Ac-2855]|nr:hypothetical protein [Microbacteriaceae bacterium VKM Ac-2855]
MTSRADALLAGPRGRRLCLEFARATASDDGALGQAIFTAAYRDTAPSRFSILISSGPDPGRSEPPPATPSDVARLLRDAALRPPTASELLDALRASVDAAMYWQEPDEQDELAAHPEVRHALVGVASIVVDSPHAEWWSDGSDATGQCIVAFDGALAPAGDANHILREWREGIADEVERAEIERPSDPSAMYSGAWWSTPPRRLASTVRALSSGAPVGLDLVEDGFGWTEARTERIRPPAAPRIFEIDGPESWAELCRGGVAVTAARRHDWYRTTGRVGTWLLPDWMRVAESYDAVHLTVDGYLTTAGGAIDVDDGASVLAGWNPDETFWLCDVERSPESAQAWTRDTPGEPWRALPG